MPPKKSGAKATPKSKRGRDDNSSEGVVNLHEELMCGICHELVVNATQTPCCGGLWCRGCIEQVKQRLCPTCRKSFTNGELVTDARSERLSASLKRSCKHHARGCTFRGSRSDVKDHEPNCPHLTVAEVRKEMQGEINSVTKEMKGQMATVTANLKGEIKNLTKVTKELGTELQKEQAEVRSLRRQLSSAQALNSTNSITTSKLQKENGLLKGVLKCNHVFSFRLHPEKSHTERCSLFSCCWFTIDVEVKCSIGKEVSLFLFRPQCNDKDVRGWSYVNGRPILIRYTAAHSPSDVQEADLTPPKDMNWPGSGWGRTSWLTDYRHGSLVTVGVTVSL